MASKASNSRNLHRFLALARISLGLEFLWAFFDKFMGLGFATCRDAKTQIITRGCKAAWVNGGSPTLGFLKFAAKGPFASFYHSLVGHSWVDWLFMAGLLLIGTALVSGVAMRIATVTGSLLLLMMWSAALWPANNPLLDEHIIYIFLLFALMYSNADQVWGARSWWVKQPIVQKFPILE